MILKLAYIGLSILMLIVILFMGFKTINKTFKNKKIAQKKRLILIISLLAWQIYIYVIASSGVLLNFDFPPRFALFLIIPAFIFTGIFLSKNKKNEWIGNLSQHWLIYYQSFRIAIETLFVYTVAAGVLHYHVTIKGYNYDMLMGYSAPVIAFLVFNKKLLSKRVLLWWNYLGLAVISIIIFLFLTTTYVPQMYGSETGLLPKYFVMYPYVLVAGFLMPSAVFMHVLSIIQLKKEVVLLF